MNSLTMPPPIQWFFVRHAPVIMPNNKSVLYGQLDLDCRVDDTSKIQGARRQLPAHHEFALLSGLRRTQRTFAALFNGQTTQHQALIDPELNEQCMGAWEGMEYTNTHAANYQKLIDDPIHCRPPDGVLGKGESFIDLKQRIARRLDHYNRRFAQHLLSTTGQLDSALDSDKSAGSPRTDGNASPPRTEKNSSAPLRVVCCSHAGVIRAVLAVALELSHANAFKPIIDNWSVTRLDAFVLPTTTRANDKEEEDTQEWTTHWRVHALNAR